ncbi:hypothetical protein CRE_18561 [Caenorhabditis remanei]|uniref:Uncharacterized protein n=1 Tax=Caenorhabditis remanei TaxID=31234 RepID=E3LJU7_CAERE|nr:hypothetical protein CRE_18561 [Caenorhabditis remanei]
MILSYTPEYILEFQSLQPATGGVEGHFQRRDDDSVTKKVTYATLTLQSIMSSINLFIQIICIVVSLYKRSTIKGPFFTLIFIFALTVTSRVIFHSVALAFNSHPNAILVYRMSRLSLYIDYWSSLFSATITFFLSLNRCLCFLSEKWNGRIFVGLRIFCLIIFCVIISVLGTFGIIITSEIVRKYYTNTGFIDTGSDTGYKDSINRFFNMFPVGSVVCYIILFFHLRNENKGRLNKSIFSKRGENKVFSHLIITAILYLILNIMYEVVVVFGNEFSLQLLTWLTVLTIFNYLPEMSLSLLFIFDTMHFGISNLKFPKKKVRKTTAIKSINTI